jgi:hypothetical protein
VSAPTIDDASLTIRDGEDQLVEFAIKDAHADLLQDAQPYRTFRWYLGQRHYSGSYWSSTESAHVIYESRLELARLLMADFDKSVSRIVAQPFLLRAKVNGKVRRHVPDYWLLTTDGSVVVDVKPEKRLSDPVVQATFKWTRGLVESIGWGFEVASEQPEALLENVRFLSGYRRAECISQSCLAALRALNVDGIEFRDVRQSISHPKPLVHAALLHMLWTHELAADLSDVLWSKTVLWQEAVTDADARHR